MALPPPAPDPAAGGDPMADAPEDAPAADTVVCTICKTGDGSYTVYAGDEPDAGGDDAGMGADGAGGAGALGGDAGGMGTGGKPAAEMAGPQGTPAPDIGAALKAAMDVLQDDASSDGAPGSAQDQFNSGFTSDKTPTLASGAGARF